MGLVYLHIYIWLNFMANVGEIYHTWIYMDPIGRGTTETIKNPILSDSFVIDIPSVLLPFHIYLHLPGPYIFGSRAVESIDNYLICWLASEQEVTNIYE